MREREGGRKGERIERWRRVVRESEGGGEREVGGGYRAHNNLSPKNLRISYFYAFTLVCGTEC